MLCNKLRHVPLILSTAEMPDNPSHARLSDKHEVKGLPEANSVPLQMSPRAITQIYPQYRNVCILLLCVYLCLRPDVVLCW